MVFPSASVLLAELLAEAGLLDESECTTHWRYTEQLRRDYPRAKVLTDRLFVKCGNVYTSAGVTTGLDFYLDPAMMNPNASERIRNVLQQALETLERLKPPT